MNIIHPKITQLSLSQFGLDETHLEPNDEPFSIVICDVISISTEIDARKVGLDFEKNIKEYLEMHHNDLSVKLLKRSVERAQNYFFKQYLKYEGLLKISLLILLKTPKLTASSSPDKVLVTSMGDIKFFSLDSSIQLAYYDAKSPQLPDNLSTKKRFSYLNNAIGCKDLNFNYSEIPVEPRTSLLMATYGSYQQTPQDKLYALFSDYENKRHLVGKLMTKSKGKSDLRSFLLIDFQKKAHPDFSSPLALSSSKLPHHELSSKKVRLFPVWAIKIACVAVVCLLSLEFFNHYLNSQRDTTERNLGVGRPKEIHTQFTLKSIKKPLEFPFLKERAYIVDLKDRYKRQLELIDKLQQIINEQDKTLCELQVKEFYQQEAVTSNNSPQSEPHLEN